MQPPVYVDDHLLKDGKVKRGAILGQAGGVWAASPGYKVRAPDLIGCISPHISGTAQA